MGFEKYPNKEAEIELYKDIRNIITDLKNTGSKSKFSRLSADLNNLYEIAGYFNLYDYPLVDDYVSRPTTIFDSDIKYNIFRKNNQKFFDLITKELDYHREIAILFEQFLLNDYKKEYRPLAYINNFEEIQTYAEDFMKNFDLGLYEIYKNIKDNNHILIKEQDETGLGGLYTHLSYNRTPYLSFFLNNNIDDSSTIAHETAHAKQGRIMYNNKTYDNYNYIFKEVYSYYVQFCFYKYMNDKKIFVEDVNACFNNWLDDLCKYLINLNDDLNNINPSELQIYENFEYSYGILLALHFFDIYQNDPEYAKLLTNEFIEHSYKKEPYEVLNDFGLDYDEIASGDILRKYIKKGRL